MKSLFASLICFGVFGVSSAVATEVASGPTSHELPFSAEFHVPTADNFSLEQEPVQPADISELDQEDSVLAHVIPEPGTLAMMGLGSLLSLMVYSRYRLG